MGLETKPQPCWVVYEDLKIESKLFLSERIDESKKKIDPAKRHCISPKVTQTQKQFKDCTQIVANLLIDRRKHAAAIEAIFTVHLQPGTKSALYRLCARDKHCMISASEGR